MLKIENLKVAYGAVQALHGISLEVREGEMVALIGANGAGKTTLLRTISGLIHPSSGQLNYASLSGEVSLKGIPSHKIVKLGISQVPEGRMVFPNLSVRENLDLGAYLRKDQQQIKEDYERTFCLFPRLKERLHQSAATLSGGEQQMLAMGRALMARPRLLLMDEPSLGLAPILVQAIFKNIREINQQGLTILLIEQNANMALKFAHRGYVLETGKILLEGTSESLIQNPDIKKAYLGG